MKSSAHNPAGYFVSTDKALLDLDCLYDYLTNRSYWAEGRERAVFDMSVRNSLCFGLYDSGNRQAGFARIITDFAVYAYILDLFILEPHRSQGLGKMLMDYMIEFPDLKRIKKWTLATRDAHGLYAQFGFTPLRIRKDIWNARVTNIKMLSNNLSIIRTILIKSLVKPFYRRIHRN